MAKLARNISIYSLGNILNKGVMFLLLPLYTRVLQPADYGKLELVNTVGAILMLVYGLMVENGYSRIYFQKKDLEWRKELFFSGQVFNLFCAVVFGSLSFVYSETLSTAIFNFPNGAVFLRLVTIVTLLKVLTHIPYNNIRNRQKAKLFVTLNLSYLIVNILLTVFFLVIMKIGVRGVLYAQILSGILELSALYYFTRDENGIKFSLDSLKMMLGFSIFLIPSNLSGYVLNYSNRYFLNEYQNLQQVGLYSLGAKLSGVIPFLFTEPVKKAFGPHLYELIDEPEKCKKVLADFTRVFFAGLAFVALSISLFSKEIVTLIADKSYSGSFNVVFILSASYLFLGLAGIIVIGIHMTLKTWIVTIIWPVSAAVNILLNILLIPKYGRMGAATATMLSVLFINISYFIAVSKVYPTKFAYFKFIQMFLLMTGFNYAGSFIHLKIAYAVLLKVLLLLLFIYVIYAIKYFTDEEVEKAKNVIIRFKSKFKI